MFLAFLLFWILLNGRLTVEILLFGLVISGLIFIFICRFMDYSPRKERLLWKSAGMLVQFLWVLLREIVIANYHVIRLVLSPKYMPEPAMVYFRTNLRSGFARVLLANAITLTPGTIIVSLVEGEYCIHCLDKSYADGIEDSVFVRLLEQMEACWE